MSFTPEWISYHSTNAFSALANDYLQEQNSLRPFYQFSPDLTGISNAVEARKTFNTDRATLVTTLQAQYAEINTTEKVKRNIEQLASPNTFTVCTAHQPNLFTGYLYFIYKILHAIKLSDELNQAFPQNHFVPVYYMGSEDNDLEELNHIYLGDDKLVWETHQSGAVGRMHTKGIDSLIDRISGELGVLDYGKELVSLLTASYAQSATIQEATLRFVNSLFETYGLVTIIADHAAFKKTMFPIFEDDLFRHTPSAIVQQTAQRLSESYHAQVNPREINLFYLKDAVRERIIKTDSGFNVNNTNITFSSDEMLNELQQHPERFSPNVVLRGLFQESILPNVAFIGGGSEIAYWLELKDMFHHYNIPYPVLLLRNSFLIIEQKPAKLISKLKLSSEDLFTDAGTLLNQIVQHNSSRQLSLAQELNQAADFYKHVESVARKIDPTLSRHVFALETKASKLLKNLEKKMLKAEKRKFNEQNIQLQAIKSALFPRNTLQERVENILPYYARYGQSFIQMLYQHSPTLGKKFGILKED